MVSKLRPPNVDVKSLTTVATPHRGSVFADYLMDEIGPKNLPKIYRLLESMGLETKAFSQLTSSYVQNEFNPQVPDVEGIRYFSYGSSYNPTIFSSFRFSHDVMKRLEDSENDGLVSVKSSKWGEYKGTLEGVSHLDVINWTNWNVRFWSLLGRSKKFNAIAFYLDIADMLAKEGL
jgi:triacylglycerol lipase